MIFNGCGICLIAFDPLFPYPEIFYRRLREEISRICLDAFCMSLNVGARDRKARVFSDSMIGQLFQERNCSLIGQWSAFQRLPNMGPRSVERNTRCYGGFSFTSARRKEQIGVWIAVDTLKRIFSLIWNPAMHESRSLKWFLSYFTWQNMCHIIHHFKAQNFKNLKLWLTQNWIFRLPTQTDRAGHKCTCI